METEINEIEINGVQYISKDGVSEKAESVDGMEYKLVRTHSAGVFFGYVEKRDGMEVTLRKARRVWYWDGAASLSQLATDGTSKPENCKLPCEVDRIVLTQAIEILDVTKKAIASISGVPIWKK